LIIELKNYNLVIPKDKIMIRKFLLSAMILLALLNLDAQDPGFTQFFTNPTYYNPALSGSSDGFNARTNYRNFWRKMDHGLNTLDISLDSEEPFLSGGIGLIMLSGIEGNGVIKTNMLGLSYAYNLIVIPRVFDIQMGLQGAYVQKNFQIKNLVFSDQLDPIFGITGTSAYSYAGINNIIYPDFATGINLRFNVGKVIQSTPKATVNAGLAMHHITQLNESFTGMVSKVPIKTVIYANSLIKLDLSYSKSIFITPSFIYESQNVFKTMVIGSNVMLKPIYVGLWFRNGGLDFGKNSLKSLAVNVGLNMKIGSNNLQLGYSYDINISQLQNLMGDAHEISIRMQFDDVSFFGDKSAVSRKASQNRACFNKF